VGYVDPTRSLDGERFALPADSAAYAGFRLTIGPNLSAGQVHRFIYDSKGRRTEQVSTDNYRGQVADRRWGYSRAGALVGDTLLFQDGATVARTYDYNRRGQRIAARSTVTITTGTLAAEPGDQTLSYYNGTTARLDSVVS
jgi:YD repeat-containing protein